MNSRFHEPLSDHYQNFHVRLVCMVKSRGINEDDGITVGGMCSLDSFNFGCARFPATAHGVVVLACSTFDELWMGQ
jgi:hypothetical protein